MAIGTVSNVLNNPDLVSEQTRVKVEAAIAELGFVRNSAARALAARRTDTVGLVLIDIGNSLFVDESSIPVSTVSLPGYRMGELAIELLLDEVRQGSSHVHRTVMPDPHLIPRRSRSGP
jgi:DNA-binding LacI/PurR family transcriptional regulator